MEALALYLIKVHIAITLLYGIYYFTLRNELFFQLNRFILLSIILLSFSLPLLSSISFHGIEKSSINIGASLSSQVSTDSIKGKEVAKFEDEIQLKRLSGVVTSLLAFYLLGVFYFLLKFLSQVSAVMTLIRSSAKVNHGRSGFLDPGEIVPAFSFFNSIVVNPRHHDDAQLSQIIAHEQAHVRQMHSADIMLAELASVILWGNPVAKAVKNSVRMNLEFLADQEVLERGFDKTAYQWSIVKPYLMRSEYPLTNQYNSKPKQRIERMNAGRRSFVSLYKYALIIPMVAFVYIWIAPFHASALDRILTMKRIDNHEYRNYLGYYEFERDKGSFVRIMMKDELLVMNTLWNNKKIYFKKLSENKFVNSETSVPLVFPRNYEGAVTGLVAFGDDRWTKVQKYTPVNKRSGEGTVISRTSSGGMQVMVYAIEPWANVRHYDLESAVSSP